MRNIQATYLPETGEVDVTIDGETRGVFSALEAVHLKQVLCCALDRMRKHRRAVEEAADPALGRRRRSGGPLRLRQKIQTTTVAYDPEE